MTSGNRQSVPTEDAGRLLPLALADDLREGLVVIDADSVIQYANPAMTRIFGYGRAELEGRSLTILMPEEYRDRHREALDRYLASGERHLPWSGVELPGRHRDGQRLDLRISFSEFTRHGTRLFAGTIRDRTAAKDPEEERRIQVRSHRALFGEDVTAAFRMGPEGTVRSVNGALARMAGHESTEELVGREAAELFGECDDLPLFVEDIRDRRGIRNQELPLRCADGTTRWSLVNGVWIDDPADASPEVLLGTVVDISDRKEMEWELARSRERYRRLFEQDVAGVYRSDAAAHGRLIECNQAFADIFGYESPEEVVGTPARAFLSEEEDRQAVVEQLRREGAIVRREAELRRKDGSSVWALVHARLVEDREYGELLEGTIVDVTEQRRAREALERAKEKFQGVFAISPVALKIVDPETDEYLEVNRAFAEVFGQDQDALLSGDVSADTLWEDPSRREALYRRVREGGTVRREEVRLLRKGGVPFDGLFSASTLELDGRAYLVAAIEDVSELKRVERELEHRALHDHLTGLPNRTLFGDRMEHALDRSTRTGETLAVLFLDLDGFKRVNDLYGHGEGDEVLRQLGRRLGGGIREQDTVARIGGDEFGILVESLDDEEDAGEVADRLLETLDAPFEVGDDEVFLDGSCGITYWRGDSDDPESRPPGPTTLLRQADLAMYAAKDQPGTRWRVFSPEVEAAEPRPLREEMRLRRAVEEEEFEPYYQPIVRLEDRACVGAEALARWEDSERGLVPPVEFIPLAEETGLIIELGHQVSRAAWRDLLRWRTEGLVSPEFQLRLNLSARQLGDLEIVESVEALLRTGELEPETLAFEITESAAMGTAGVTARLQELGVELSIDDFGTEYATLERIVALDVDSLKLDRRFVSRVTEGGRHHSVIQATLSLASALEIPVIAEGVETDEQVERLKDLGCRYAQGFLFARPMPAGEFIEWLGGQHPH